MSIRTVQIGNNYDAGTKYKVFQITSRNDKADLPTDCAPGSRALPADKSFEFALSNEREWVEKVVTIVDLNSILDADSSTSDWGTI